MVAISAEGLPAWLDWLAPLPMPECGHRLERGHMLEAGHL